MRWEMGVDLGTMNVRMAGAREGLILDESAALVMNGSGAAIYAGDAAWAVSGREPTGLDVVWPLCDGVPDSTLHTQRLFQWLIRRADAEKRRRRGMLVTCAPFSRPAYREALMQSALDAGATDVALVRSDAACAIGAGADFFAPRGTFVVDIGAGKATATLFSLGREVVSGHLPFGLNRINARITDALRADYGFAVGPHGAEDVKLALASASGADVSTVKTRVSGLNIAERAPGIVEISSELVKKLCDHMLFELVGLCRAVAAKAPEGLSADMNDSGILLCGGGALLPGMDKLLGDALGVPCSVPEAPTLCAVKGVQAMLLEPERFSDVVGQRMTIARRR